MNVKFLNTNYRPTDEQLAALEKMQELIHYTRIEYFFQIRKESPRMQAARIEELRRMYRARWEVISNCDENIQYSE